jgi:hypothetical protein
MFIKSLNKKLQFLAVWGFVLFCPALLAAQNYTGSPVTKNRLIKVVQSKAVALPLIVKLIKESGVNFKLTPEVERELLAVKTNGQIIDAAKNNFRAPINTTSAKNTNAPNKNVAANSLKQEDTAEKYEQLYYQGLQMIDQLRRQPPGSRLSISLNP